MGHHHAPPQLFAVGQADGGCIRIIADALELHCAVTIAAYRGLRAPHEAADVLAEGGEVYDRATGLCIFLSVTRDVFVI